MKKIIGNKLYDTEKAEKIYSFMQKRKTFKIGPVLKELIVNMNLDIDLCKLDELDRNILDQDEAIPQWGAQINSMWTDYILAGMDVGSDSYVVLILTREDFAKAKELARGILQRIALLEEM